MPHSASEVLGFSQVLTDVPDRALYPDVEICLQRGDVCVHATNTVHYSPPNETDHPRRQPAIECRSTRAKQDPALLARRRKAVEKLHQRRG